MALKTQFYDHNACVCVFLAHQQDNELFVSLCRGEDQCSNFLTDTIQFFQGDFTDFFEKDIPNFFESTIPKTAIHVGDEIVDVAETGISELVKFTNGELQTRLQIDVTFCPCGSCLHSLQVVLLIPNTLES